MMMISLIITNLVLIQSILSLNSADLCRTLKECNKNHSYKCEVDLCSLNRITCDDYYDFKRYNAFRSLFILKKFQAKIQKCEKFKLTTKDYCLNNSSCFRKQSLITRNGFKTIKIKVDCTCKKKYSFKCSDKYCTLDKTYCDLLNLRLKYQKKLNKTETQNCFSS